MTLWDALDNEHGDLIDEITLYVTYFSYFDAREDGTIDLYQIEDPLFYDDLLKVCL